MNENLPKHIAIILDGNGRYAKKNFMPRQFGHKKGAENLKEIVSYANKIGIEYLTVYAFSTENWNRDKKEVEFLMGLLTNYLDTFISDPNTTNVKISMIGDKSGLSKKIVEKINKVENLTKDNDGTSLIVAINYGGRDEITRAVNNIVLDIENNKIKNTDITEKLITSYLDTKEIPDPDLLIRTSLEYRLSNFLLWQLAYTELYFCEKLWPEFTTDDLDSAILNYQNRERRYGGLKDEN